MTAPPFAVVQIEAATAELADQRGHRVGIVYRRYGGTWELFLYAEDGIRLTRETVKDLATTCDDWAAGVRRAPASTPSPETHP